LTHDELILPFTVMELWDNFFEDYAPYSFDDVGVALGVMIDSKTDWEEPEITTF